MLLPGFEELLHKFTEDSFLQLLVRTSKIPQSGEQTVKVPRRSIITSSPFMDSYRNQANNSLQESKSSAHIWSLYPGSSTSCAVYHQSFQAEHMDPPSSPEDTARCA